ncbi:PAT1 multi-domain protein [Pyrenophora tritici-repentis]|nr:hypothetical protein PtrSN001A_001996 [Pyrenophora tritici-repentis]KAI1576495.1 hypothetical protein PtrEW4_002091 [Pyrenophora tritici-repentis]PZD34238.1 PAT1 multi-domain protein [Pyrenophora tritici-repentis]
MAALAFKAISYGAEQIPDKFFEKIPGGFFTPAEQKEIDKNRKTKGKSRKERRQSEEPSARRSSRRERSPPTDDTRDMAQPGQGQPYFPPPPASEYRPYNPQEYAPSPVQDHRPSATPAYGYPSQPAAPQPYGRTQDYGQHETSRAAARYTPDAGYAPSPVADAPIPPPPVGSNSPMNPYHHTDFPANGAGYQPSPPPFSRQRSNSQPPFAPMPEPAYPTYPTANREQVVPYAESSPRRDSTRHRRDTRHRARSVDSHSHHSRSSKDHRRDDDSRMAKMRDRFDSMDLREKSLAASLGGAAAGALGARQVATRSR